MATPALWRTEQQANTGTADIPGIFDPQIIGLSNGNILVAWSEFGTSGVGVTAGIDIIGKIYAGDGITVVRDSYRINQTRNVHEESDYDIAATNDGGFILVYVDNDGVDSRVVWERKNAIGNNIYSRDIVSETGAGDYDNPQIAVSSSSNASYVTFTDLQLPVGVANNDDISGVRLNSVGTVITSEFDAAENTADDFRDADTAINTNGELVTVHRNIDASEIVIEVRSLAGVLQHRTMVDNTGNPTDPQIATLSNGNIAVTWRDDADDVNYAVYNSNLGLVQVGTSIDNSLAQQPEIAALPNGEFVIIWYETNGIISGRKYNSDGTADGAAFTINTGAATSPNIGVTGDGRLLITWEEGDNVSFEIWDPRDGNILAGTYDTPPLNFVAGGDIYSKVGGSTIVGDNGAPDNIIGDDGGVDFIYGNNGDDTINGYGGNDIIFGGSGNDSILGGAGVDSIFGDTGNDTIISGSGRDNVIAGAGDDLIILGADDYMDSVNGGDGNDTLDHSGVGIGLFGGFYDAYINFDTGILTDIVGFTATITNIETYIDNDGGNRIFMGGDLRVVEAMGGDDTISARTGAVTIDAGAGNDLVNATSGDSHLYDGGAGTDTIDLTYYTGNYQFNMTTGATGFLKTFLNFENAITESGNDSITGNAAANEITTSDGDDTIIGLGGDDRLNGGAGNDLLDGGAGLDTVIYNNTSSDLVIDLSLSGMQTISADMGNDTFVSIEGIMTSVGNDLLIGNAANNVIFSNMGNDSIYGGDGNDTLTSSWGNNFINGEVGNDSLTGGYGSDTINGGDGNDLIDAYVFGISSQQDVLNGDAGNDTIFASTNNDLVNGGTGDDSLDGNAGNDDIFGGDGNDYMDGSAGDDSLEGNDGNDVMRGGIGNDLFNGGGGFDTADYSDATTDLVANINFVGAQTVSAMMGIDTYVS
ncbi:MAG: calcium-binding protein, partial [Sulfitobacter sp.]